MRCSGLLAFALLLAACSDDEAPGAAGSSGTGTTTSGPEGSSSTTDAPTTTGITASASGTTSAQTSSDAESSTSDEPDPTTGGASTGTTGCTPGDNGCACDEDACNDGLVCVDDVCEPPAACDQDLLEPNDEESAPTLLGEVGDNDDNGGAVFGTLNSADDVDWYRYNGNDTILGNVDPARFVKSDAGVRLCKFAECEGGIDVTEFDCPPETEPATSPAGRPGCCAPMGIALDDANCTGGLDDDMQVFLRVDQGGAACVNYELIYHY